jgi:hypothetical protein
VSNDKLKEIVHGFETCDARHTRYEAGERTRSCHPLISAASALIHSRDDHVCTTFRLRHSIRHATHPHRKEENHRHVRSHPASLTDLPDLKKRQAHRDTSEHVPYPTTYALNHDQNACITVISSYFASSDAKGSSSAVRRCWG